MSKSEDKRILNKMKSEHFLETTEYSVSRTTVDNPHEILVSAIVSTYNSERFFRGCLNDLLSQSLYKKGQLEILVVDSNSQQNESSILHEFEKSYRNITYLRTVNREPLYTSWNRAIQFARGKYLTNANTDDRHREDAIEYLSSVLENSPEFALAYADIIVTENENESFECCTPKSYIEYPDFDPIYQIHFGQCGPQPLWRKDLHNKYGGFADGFKTCADYEWWLRLARNEKFIHIPELLGLYLDSPTSIEHRAPQITQTETDIIRNFYAAAAGVALDHQSYPNRALRDFYSRHELNQSSRRELSLVLLSSPGISRKIIEKLQHVRNHNCLELILVGEYSSDFIQTVENLKPKMRIRLVPCNRNLTPILKAGLGAMHCSGSSLSFAWEEEQVNLAQLERAAHVLSEKKCQILVLEDIPKPQASIGPDFKLHNAVFSSNVFNEIKRSSLFHELPFFMDKLNSLCPGS